MTKAIQGMCRDFVRDALVERATEAAARLAIHLGDDPGAVEAWKAAHLLKALRRADVTERLDAERMEKARAT